MLLFLLCYVLSLLLALCLLLCTMNALKKLDANLSHQSRDYAKLFSFDVRTTFSLTWGYLTLATVQVPTALTATLISAAIWASGIVMSILFSRGAFDRCTVRTLKAIGGSTLFCHITALMVFGELVANGAFT